ncbi:MAG: glycosyltransferase family 4 protein [Myxococcota bacterium]|nr:glycosyltransferase family 4 protein [Myxococcota bacterium]
MAPDRPLRIAFVAYRGNMKCGGQGVYLWFLARALAQQGHSIDVFVGPPYPDPMPFADSVTEMANQELWGKWYGRDYAGMRPPEGAAHMLMPLRFYELAASYLGFLPEPFAFSVRTFREMSAQLRAGARWDLVHDVQCLGWGLLGLRALGLPMVTTVHHPLTVDRRASFVRDANLREAIGTMAFYPIGMQSFVARRLDRVLTSSEWSANRIADDFGVHSEKIRNVYNGIDTELFSPDPNVEKSDAELVCVGRAGDPNKGIQTLIAALARGDSNLKLTLVDDDHPDNPVFKWARKAGVADRLHVTGRIPTDDLIGLYRRATLVVVPSRFEGFGLPAVEAMACGTPVVACEAGALREVMQLCAGGVVVPRDNPDALAGGISELMAAPLRRAELAARARKQVEDQLSWERIAAATAEVYAEVLAEGRGEPARTTTSEIVGQRRAMTSKV